MSLGIKLFETSLDPAAAESNDSQIENLLEYKEYLEKELEKVKAELRKKIQR
jgi:hypothetical protein